MTAIKQKAICSARHWSNVASYLDDERVLARSSQNLVDQDRWAAEMHATREAYGHNQPGKAGSKCTRAYHQIIAFNPDECSMNGGVITPAFAMDYACEYASSRYPNQEAVWALHCERCSADGTERYAVHLVINRTDLETGRRLNEGRSRNAKIARANAIRDLDAKHGLAQLREGERNSRVHARQPTRQEQEMAARGVRSDKQYLREAIKASVREASLGSGKNKVRALAESLDAKGVTMGVENNGSGFTFERRSTGFKVRGYKLGRGFSAAGIVRALGIEAARVMEMAIEESMER